MLNKKVNQEIISVWKEFEHADPNLLAPIFYNDFKKERPILFIGSNPSFSERAAKYIPKGTAFENYNFKWSEVSKKDPELYVREAVEMDKLAFDKYQVYFKKFKEIAKYLNLGWEHLDLFFYRQTSQKDFRKFIHTDKKQTELTEFGKKQLKIALQMIELIQPSIILVANASASEIIKKNKEIFSETFASHGLHTIKIGNRRVPIFFSSMISGQRALDNNSLDRLKWHMKKALTTKF